MSRRRRARTAGRLRRPRAATAALCLAVVIATLAGACGRGPAASPPTASPSAGAPAPTAAPAGVATPAPRPSPQITSGAAPGGAVQAVRGFWRLLGERRFARLRAAVAPGSPLADRHLIWDVAAARLLAVHPRATGVVPPYATVEFKIDVFVKPTAGHDTWGAAGNHTLWMTVTRMSDQSWRVYEYGTGP
jgi:hypothetical protein